MAFLHESHIEEADIQFFELVLGYQHINTWEKKLVGRDSLKEVVLKGILRNKLVALNPQLPEHSIKHAIEELTKSRFSMTPTLANKEVYELIRGGVPITYDDGQGQEVHDYVVATVLATVDVIQC